MALYFGKLKLKLNGDCIKVNDIKYMNLNQVTWNDIRLKSIHTYVFKETIIRTIFAG